MKKPRPLKHFQCPDCGRLYSSAYWDAVFCHHNDNCQPNQPEWHPKAFVEEDDPYPTSYSRMAVVTKVETEPVVQSDEWYVYESRNPYGYDDDEVIMKPGNSRTFPDDDGGWRRVSGPFDNQSTAMREADKLAKQAADDERKRRGRPYPPHTHSFKAMPRDLVERA